MVMGIFLPAATLNKYIVENFEQTEKCGIGKLFVFPFANFFFSNVFCENFSLIKLKGGMKFQI